MVNSVFRFPFLSPLSSSRPYLPLGVGAGEELLQDNDNLLERLEVDSEVALDLGLVGAQLGVKVLAVGGSAHGGAEDGLDEEAVVGLEGAAVGLAERVGELLRGVGDVLVEGLGGEVEATGQPEETLGGDVLLGLDLVADEVLDRLGLGRGGKEALADFLSIER